MRRAMRLAALLTAMAVGGCSTAEQYRDACRYSTTVEAEIDDCAQRRADEANTQAAIIVVLGAALVAVAVAAAGSGGGSSKNEMDLRCFPLGCPPMTPR